jgi:hypothetical protein
MGVAEVNLAWQNLEYQDQIQERFRGMFEFNKIISSNNRTDKTFAEKKQSGGTMTLVNGELCARVLDTQIDNRKLGRWCSVLFRGKHGLKLRVLTVYRPVHSLGPLSAYQQQRRVLLDNDIDLCPREQLLHDLETAIRQHKDDGEQVLVMLGDFNEDVRGRTIRTFFSDLDMRELILDLHGNNAPNTFGGGSLPIDGIFGTRHLQPSAGGYTAVNWGIPTDHRMLWLDINMESIFGEALTNIWKPHIRRLKCNDPRTVTRYNQL